MAQVIVWEEAYYKEYALPKPFLANFMRVKGLADDWVYGYTPTLNVYGREIAVRSVESEAHMHILARGEEIDEVETILARSGKNNVVLVSESGVGKTSVALGFAQRIFYGTTLSQLKHKRVFQLDVNLVLARAKDSASAIALFDTILSEAHRAGNVILVLDNIHHVVGPQRREGIGAVDISSVLIPYLQSDTFQMIALTDFASYHSHIERVPSLATLFEKVEVREFSEEQTLLVLEDMTPRLERRHHLFISYWALAEAVAASGSFIQNIPFPEKAISLLTETLAYVSTHKLFGNVVTQDHVTEVVSKKTSIPLGRIEGEEKAKLLNLEGLLHQRIIAQDEAIGQIASAMRRIRSGISERKRPIGTFLFLGPTGVGKTETAKALAAVYFGSEERMIRLDMTEYQSADSIHRLIGNADTETSAQFANAVRENPFSIVVLDELEKSHPNVQNLFLQVLDEGRLTDVFQKKVSFRNTIIIATSNAGSEFIREYVKTGQNMGVVQTRLAEYLLKNNIFKPEFLNRFDATVVFSPLKIEEIKQVAALMLGDLRVRLEKKGYVFQYNDEALDAIAQKGYNPEFGARELRRFVQEAVENKIADKIIKGEYRQGDTISLAELSI
ncbi:ATP-dependent Clp protease ATP-binding subunit, partial [Candidatus Azambacteria bacterium]|nr:ATP-dependent Clp protease ATP-binding subunit [Candidatus Azambacteria bacterium]